jgi:hypothetical protein
MPPRTPPDAGAAQDDADKELDVAEEDSFPASDPPSITDPAKTIKIGDKVERPSEV